MTVTAKRLRELGTAVSLGLPLAGCAPTTVVMEREYAGPLPRPARVLVYNFAVSPDDVKLDRGLTARFTTVAQSGAKPGAAATMGAGAVADHLAESAAVSGGLAVVSETLSATVAADAKRTAKELVARQLGPFFVAHGWIPASALPTLEKTVQADEQKLMNELNQ